MIKDYVRRKLLQESNHYTSTLTVQQVKLYITLHVH